MRPIKRQEQLLNLHYVHLVGGAEVAADLLEIWRETNQCAAKFRGVASERGYSLDQIMLFLEH